MTRFAVFTISLVTLCFAGWSNADPKPQLTSGTIYDGDRALAFTIHLPTGLGIDMPEKHPSAFDYTPHRNGVMVPGPIVRISVMGKVSSSIDDAVKRATELLLDKGTVARKDKLRNGYVVTIKEATGWQAFVEVDVGATAITCVATEIGTPDDRPAASRTELEDTCLSLHVK
jgi:hypothetical protein